MSTPETATWTTTAPSQAARPPRGTYRFCCRPGDSFGPKPQ